MLLSIPLPHLFQCYATGVSAPTGLGTASAVLAPGLTGAGATGGTGVVAGGSVITGLSAASGVGNAAPVLTVGLPGQSISGLVGYVATDGEVITAVTGTAGIGTAGSLVYSLTVGSSGAAGTGASGTPVGVTAGGATGAGSTGTAGAAAPGIVRASTGSATVVSQGGVAPAASAGLAGSAGTGGAGAPRGSSSSTIIDPAIEPVWVRTAVDEMTVTTLLDEARAMKRRRPVQPGGGASRASRKSSITGGARPGAAARSPRGPRRRSRSGSSRAPSGTWPRRSPFA